MNYKSDLYDIEAELHFETAKAIFISVTGDDKDAKWLAKSLVEWERVKGNIVKVTAPEWLLKREGLI